MLSDIKHYLRQHGEATLADIALHLDADHDAVRGMLDVWIRKHKVYKKMATASCGESCSQCDPGVTEIYVWTESAATPRPVLPTGCEHP